MRREFRVLTRQNSWGGPGVGCWRGPGIGGFEFDFGCSVGPWKKKRESRSVAGYFRGQSELRVLFLALRYLQQTSRDNKTVTCNKGMQNENYTLNNTYVVV